MNAAVDRLEFAPPPTAGLLRALALAILAHLLLLAALTWGVHWKSDATVVTAEAELWSALPQQAAPKLVQPPPVPPPPKATPTPVPVPPKTANADIALERDKQLRLEKEKQLAEQLQQDKRKQLAEQLQRDKRRQQAEQQKLALEKQRQQAEKLAEEKKKNELDAKRKEALKAQEEASRQAALAAQRADNLKRMAALAGSTGAPSATGTALQSSGPPSGAYGSRVAAKVKPNIVFTEDLANNPTAEVEVRAAPDGTIVSRKLLKTSGSKSWDDAVLKAIDKTEVLPRDADGRVPPVLVISFRPRD